MGMNLAVSSLLANQAALQVVGHNIANANTVGFSRQRVNLEQVPGQNFGGSYFGKGVQIGSVERSFNQFLTREANLSASAAEAANTRAQRLQALEQLFPMGEAGIGQQLNGFLNSWADAVSSPTNLTARAVVLTRAEEFANRLNHSAGMLEELRSTSRAQLETGIQQVNRLATGIGQINQRIVDGFSAGNPPNDLLDQRDRMVAELNKLIQVSTLEADDRSLTVFVGGSVPLVLGSQSTPLVGSESVSADGRYTIGFGSAAALIHDDLIAGGSLKGALSFYNDDVAGVSNQLGVLAMRTLELTNRQHQAGLDLNGNPGADFFRSLPASYFSTAVSHISGSAAVSWGIDSAADAPTRFQASDYRISFTGAGSGSITRLSDGHSVAFPAPAPAPPGSLTLDGLNFAGLATGAAGNEVLVRPFRGAAAAMALNLSAPAQLALASPVAVQAAAANSGNLQVQSLHWSGGHPVPIPIPTTTIAFVAGGYTVTSGTPPVTGAVQPFASGQPIVANGFSLTLRGSPAVVVAPAVGDTFTVSDAAGLSMRQNAGNGQALLALRDLETPDGTRLSDGYIPVFSAVAESLQLAQNESEFFSRIATQAETARANQTGVNLDEEAARLLQFQQAYQASAKYLQSINSIFETLLATVGR